MTGSPVHRLVFSILLFLNGTNRCTCYELTKCYKLISEEQRGRVGASANHRSYGLHIDRHTKIQKRANSLSRLLLYQEIDCIVLSLKRITIVHSIRPSANTNCTDVEWKMFAATPSHFYLSSMGELRTSGM